MATIKATEMRHLILTTEHVTTLVCAKDSVRIYEPESKELLNREKDKSKNTFSTNLICDIIMKKKFYIFMIYFCFFKCCRR